jgi:AcrR family transcriptional regulator
MERRRARTREALLGAAQQLLSTRSADGVNVDEIVELADVAKGTFYNYFTDKEAIVREVEDGARTHLEDLVAQTNAGIEDAAVRVARAFAAVLSFARSEPIRAATLLRMSPNETNPDRPINVGVRQDIVRGLKSGRFSHCTQESGVVLVIAVMQGGLSRALAVTGSKKVVALGEHLGLSLLLGLGMSADEALPIVREAMSRLA